MVQKADDERNGLRHKGKAFDNVSARQQVRHLETIQSKAKQALWFVESYGLTIQGVSLADKTGKVVTCEMDNRPAEKERDQNRGFNKLGEEEKKNVEKVLFLLDKFCGSDALYHEMAQVM